MPIDITGKFQPSDGVHGFDLLDAQDIDFTGFTVPVAGGGTNIASYAVGDILYASAATVLSKLADVAAGSYLRSGGVTTAPVWSTTTLPNAATTGDVLYASATNVYSNLAAAATGNALISGGAGTAPSWGKIALTTHVSGVLPIANGGSNKALTLSAGGILWTDSDSFEVLAGTATAGQILRSGASVTPSWSTATFPATAGTSGNVLTSDGTNWSSAAPAAGAVDVARTWSTLQKFPDDKFNIVGSSDATKILRFEIDAPVPTGTTRTLTPQDGNYIIAGTNFANIFDKTQTIIPDSDAVPLILGAYPGGGVSDLFQILDSSAAELLTIDANGSITALGSHRFGKILVSTAGSTSFADASTDTKTVLMDISGATAGFATTLDFNHTANRTITFPDESGTLILDTAHTWSTLQTFKDTTFKVVDDADATKTLVWSLGGATAGADLTLISSQTADHSITLPDATTTLAGLSNTQTFTGVSTFASTGTSPLLVGTATSGEFMPVFVPSSSSGDGVGREIFSVDQGGFRSYMTVNTQTASRQWNLPDGDGTFVTDSSATVFSNKTLSGSNNFIRCGTAQSKFTVTTSISNYFQFVLTGMTGARTFTLADKNHNLDHGTYTPTLNNTTNVAASAVVGAANYLRVGAVVNVSGSCTIDPTAAGATVLGISLPIASNFGAVEDCAGTAATISVATEGAAIVRANVANDRAEIAWTAVSIANNTWYYHFTYEII